MLQLLDATNPKTLDLELIMAKMCCILAQSTNMWDMLLLLLFFLNISQKEQKSYILICHLGYLLAGYHSINKDIFIVNWCRKENNKCIRINNNTGNKIV